MDLIQNLHADAEVAGSVVHLLQPVGPKVVAAVDGALREVVGEGTAANAADREMEAKHGAGALEAVRLELQGSLEGALLDHGGVHALALAAARAPHGFPGVREDHEAEVRQPRRHERRGHERPPHGGLKLGAHAVDPPLGASAGIARDLRQADQDARRDLRHGAEHLHLGAGPRRAGGGVPRPRGGRGRRAIRRRLVRSYGCGRRPRKRQPWRKQARRQADRIWAASGLLGLSAVPLPGRSRGVGPEPVRGVGPEPVAAGGATAERHALWCGQV
mmetsp:Transcript_11664/g.25528  ORF Transcript_11664/g.25528 Transcript_11664/m.25528 type:complete len:274 (+) Transcript_11664:264-1085(+)